MKIYQLSGDENKDHFCRACYNIAKKANFPTDLDDVYDHLYYEDPVVFYAVLNNKIVGFSCFEYYPENDILYVRGVIVDPVVQGKKLSQTLISNGVEYFSPHLLTLRTHNPRMYDSVISFSDEFYPNGEYNPSQEILKAISQIDALSKIDSDLIFRNAYPDEKISQVSKRLLTNSIFSRLHPRDAQVVVVKLSKPS